MCPITSHVKGYPFEVLIEAGAIHGAILADQLKSADWRARRVRFVSRAGAEIIREIRDKVRVLID